MILDIWNMIIGEGGGGEKERVGQVAKKDFRYLLASEFFAKIISDQSNKVLYNCKV